MHQRPYTDQQNRGNALKARPCVRLSRTYQAQMASDGFKALVFGHGEETAGEENAKQHLEQHRKHHHHQQQQEKQKNHQHKLEIESYQRPSVTFAEDRRPASHRSAALLAPPAIAALSRPSSLPKRTKSAAPKKENQAPLHASQHRGEQQLSPAAAAFFLLTHRPRPQILGTSQPLPSYSLLGSLGRLDKLGHSFSSLTPQPSPVSNQGGLLAAPSSYSRSGSSIAPPSFLPLPPPPRPPLRPMLERQQRHTNRVIINDDLAQGGKGLYMPPNSLAPRYDAPPRHARRQHKHES